MTAIPVVDHQHRLVGIVTFDDVADVMEIETTEDFHLTAAGLLLSFTIATWVMRMTGVL